MAKNTYRYDDGNDTRVKNAPRSAAKEPLSRNEFKKTNEPKEAKPKKEKKPFVMPAFNLPRITFLKDRRVQLLFGFFFLLGSLYLAIAFISYLFTGPADQSVVEALNQSPVKDSGLETENWLGLAGAFVANYLINDYLGLSAFFLIPIIFFLGYKIVFRRTGVSLSYINTLCLFSLLWTCLLGGYLVLSTSSVDEYG